MKIKKTYALGFAIVILLLLASGVSAQSFIQGPVLTRVDSAKPASILSIATHVSEAINYQGVLEENGVPVTGSRDMSFSLYSEDSCSTFISGIVEINDVSVDNGLFSVQLAFDPSVFTGQVLFLEVEVEGTAIACQEILPVPYALSLRPEAIISTESTVSYASAVTGEVSSTTPGSYSAGLRGINNGAGGTGIGVYGSQAGWGWGVYGQVEGNGRGVYGDADGDTGIGVYGASNGTNGVGVYAQGGGTSSYALMLDNGAIGVNGAGVGTSTPVFIHQAINSNITCGFNQCTLIDHPLTNANPNAILIVTPNFNSATYPSMVNNPHPVGVQYLDTSSRWVIYNVDLVAMTEGAAFNVLVVKP
jgi:hypothetical protein